jgi:beta-galactosidase/beta-glucuronidase
VIRGVGYNPQYASLDPTERERLYQRDFGKMRRMGVNTIEGWFEPQFDRVTLDAAASNGIGVIMPFEINQDWPLENANVRKSILDHVSAMVERYRDYPAVRMWASSRLMKKAVPLWIRQAHHERDRSS